MCVSKCVYEQVCKVGVEKERNPEERKEGRK